MQISFFHLFSSCEYLRVHEGVPNTLNIFTASTFCFQISYAIQFTQFKVSSDLVLHPQLTEQ